MTTIGGSRLCRCLAAMALLAGAACAGQPEPTTPAEKSARGDELLRKMSDTLKNTQAFSVTIAETHEKAGRNGQKSAYTLTREVVVRRPDRLWLHTTGSDERNITTAYDGKTVTLVGATQKAWATFPGGSNVDETLDIAGDRYNLRIAAADFLYSSPYDSFADKESTGGWVRRTTVDGRSCEEVSYALKAVDFTLSVASACQVSITYKEEPGQPVSKLVFNNWNLTAQPQDGQFVANVPQGYEQIPMVERIPKSELKANAAKAMGAAQRK
jgi:hypothetical protein